MSCLAPSTSFLQPTRGIGQGAIYGELQRQRNSSYTVSIHVLDDDSLLHVLYLSRPPTFDGNESDIKRSIGGRRWDRERWWIKFAHVCQRWRNLIFASASYLGLCLVCARGTPVADMLVHSPPLPLVIDYFSLKKDITTEDEEGIILALEKRDRVCRIRLAVPFPKLQRIILAIDGEYPRLEYLIMGPLMGDNGTALMLPERFQAPRLCHLLLKSFALPMEYRLLTTAVGLVALTLILDHPSTYFQPNSMLQLLSSMPRLEMFGINFSYPVSDDDVERQLMHIPTMTNAILPNLRSFLFRGVGAYMRAIAPWLTTPRLEKLEIDFNQLTYSVPPLLQFMETTENLRFDSVKLEFDFSKGRFFVGMSL